jgi:hypothetical protein
MEKHLKKAVTARRPDAIRVGECFKSDMISAGLRQALATGNWGKDKDNNV